MCRKNKKNVDPQKRIYETPVDRATKIEVEERKEERMKNEVVESSNLGQKGKPFISFPFFFLCVVYITAVGVPTTYPRSEKICTET